MYMDSSFRNCTRQAGPGFPKLYISMPAPARLNQALPKMYIPTASPSDAAGCQPSYHRTGLPKLCTLIGETGL
jgi:hypothetical protein